MGLLPLIPPQEPLATPPADRSAAQDAHLTQPAPSTTSSESADQQEQPCDSAAMQGSPAVPAGAGSKRPGALAHEVLQGSPRRLCDDDEQPHKRARQAGPEEAGAGAGLAVVFVKGELGPKGELEGETGVAGVADKAEAVTQGVGDEVGAEMEGIDEVADCSVGVQVASTGQEEAGEAGTEAEADAAEWDGGADLQAEEDSEAGAGEPTIKVEEAAAAGAVQPAELECKAVAHVGAVTEEAGGPVLASPVQPSSASFAPSPASVPAIAAPAAAAAATAVLPSAAATDVTAARPPSQPAPLTTTIALQTPATVSTAPSPVSAQPPFLLTVASLSSHSQPAAQDAAGSANRPEPGSKPQGPAVRGGSAEPSSNPTGCVERPDVSGGSAWLPSRPAEGAEQAAPREGSAYVAETTLRTAGAQQSAASTAGSTGGTTSAPSECEDNAITSGASPVLGGLVVPEEQARPAEPPASPTPLDVAEQPTLPAKPLTSPAAPNAPNVADEEVQRPRKHWRFASAHIPRALLLPYQQERVYKGVEALLAGPAGQRTQVWEGVGDGVGCGCVRVRGVWEGRHGE